MSRSEKDGSPIQPDGSLLSLVGDLLFAGAILVMIYPCLRKTVSRLDGQFFRQFFHVTEILLAVAALCFVLMLLIAQQMRVAYCSFIRPYVGDSNEDKAYVSVLLKILVCVLMLVNYFCASGLHRLVGFVNERFQPHPPVQERIRNAGTQRARYVAFGDALMNNSNTNSQTPVTQTQSVMQSDILPSMSFPELTSDPCQGSAPSTHQQRRQCRDVGTMVRFPVTEYQHSSQCTLHFCPAHSSRPSTAPATIVYTSIPSTTTSTPRHSTPVSLYNPHPQAGVPSRGGYGSGLARAQNSYHVHLNNLRSASHMGSRLPCGWDNFQHTACKAQSSCSSGVQYQSNGQGASWIDSDLPSSYFASDCTGSESSSGGSDQSSFLSRLGLTSVRQDGQSPRVGVSVQSCFHKDLGSGTTQSHSADYLHSPKTTQTQSQSGPAFVWSQTGACDPVVIKSGCQMGHSSVITINSHSHVPRTSSVASNGLSGIVPTHLASSSHSESCVMSGGQSTHHSSVSVMDCGCGTSQNDTRRPSTTRSVRRRFRLPPMPKMTRSGKIYGY